MVKYKLKIFEVDLRLRACERVMFVCQVRPGDPCRAQVRPDQGLRGWLGRKLVHVPRLPGAHQSRPRVQWRT